MKAEAVFRISRFLPAFSNSISISASLPVGCTEITVPSPNALWRTLSPAAKEAVGFFSVGAGSARLLSGAALLRLPSRYAGLPVLMLPP